MDHPAGTRSRTYSSLAALLAAGLMWSLGAAAQTSTPTPPPTPPGTAPQPSAQTPEDWRATMSRTPTPKSGCFESSYPSTEWKEVPCQTPPLRPYPPRPGGPPGVVGSTNNDVSALVTGQLTSAAGSFDSVSGVTTETGTTFPGSTCNNPTAGVANIFSLQLNARPFTTSVCTANPGCQGWQQFIYSSGVNQAFMQYWLLNVGAACPAGWTPFQNGAQLDCFQNSPGAASVPAQTIAGLSNMILTGTAANGGNDTVALSEGSPPTLHKTSAADNILNLAKAWDVAEFNIFGDSCSTQAVFAGTPTIVVRTHVENGTRNAPSCLAQSFTGETNNLSFGPAAPTANPGPAPAVLLEESSAGGAPSACAAATSVGDTHLTTFAGTHYDFQASGDFVLAQAGPDFAVHTRQASGAPTWPNAALNKAVAAQIGKTTVALCAAPTRLVIDGKLHNLADGKSVSLADGVTIWRSGNAYFAKNKNGDSVKAQFNHTSSPNNDWIDVTVGLGDGSQMAGMRGLLGNPNGNANELAASNGTVLQQPISFEELYGRYGNSWRIPLAQSLLCKERQVPSGNPTAPLYANDLTPQQQQRARAICEAAGVKEGAALDDCMLDVTVFGSKTAANVFVRTRAPTVVIKPGEGYKR
ncbi:MAG: VWD domain-containing protein [Alphaproteobacteria bacterium]|nr:VWD domain-containing protein [Alphaproteobacteria bacterium]